MTHDSQKLLALLFVAGDAVSKKELLRLLEVADIANTISETRDRLHESGLTLVETNETVQLTTHPNMSEFLNAFSSEPVRELTKAAAEALAIIAYRGPIARYEIDAIRGVDSRGTIRQLVKRGVISQLRSAGKTVVYDISDEALRHLNVTRREDLPQFEQLRNYELD